MPRWGSPRQMGTVGNRSIASEGRFRGKLRAEPPRYLGALSSVQNSSVFPLSGLLDTLLLTLKHPAQASASDLFLSQWDSEDPLFVGATGCTKM